MNRAIFLEPETVRAHGNIIRYCRVAALILGALLLNACSAIGLPNVATHVSGAPASPPILAPFESTPAVTTVAAWEEARAPLLRDAFQSQIYGYLPLPTHVHIIERTSLKLDIAGLGTAQQWVVQIGETSLDVRFSMVVLLPKTNLPAPMILMQNFCGNALALDSAAGVNAPRRGTPKECQHSMMLPLVPVIFGGAIVRPPLERILAAGYGVAMLYAGDVVPDNPVLAEPILKTLMRPAVPPAQRPGAIAAWAWTYTRALDVLSNDPMIDPARITLWGHSRYGKAALLAAAFDSRPHSVIALQSGTAGGSIGRDEVGESIKKITQSFPHWFAPAFSDWASQQDRLPIDQHQLLALIAPRPVLLGSGRRDSWSDPHGAVRAAAGASPVYELYGQPPFTQTDLRKPDFRPNLVTYMRRGLHGIHSEDWDMALEFLDKK